MQKNKAGFCLMNVAIYLALLTLLCLFSARLLVRATQELTLLVNQVPIKSDMLCAYDLFERDCSQAPAGASAWVQAKEHSLVWKVGNDICRGWCFKKGSLFRRRGKFNQKKGTWSRGSSSLLANGLDDVRFAVYHDQQGNEFLSHVACWMIAGGVKTKRLVRISNGRYYTH
ncbi:hypothetical protein HOL34_02375 [bacterium]|jgi:hypothetical protein|nr:hypothetical protein [bacterium]MBT3903603.1 hypothetical protein [bacterium]MBT4577877.1 hypothetical protein [bacterium]MBT5345944.1 hypothetical protein [bacterium]MBT6130730.1 hypothetical protein [bacterium]